MLTNRELEAGMRYWAKRLQDLSETLALYDRCEKAGTATDIVNTWRHNIQVFYDHAQKEYDLLDTQWKEAIEQQAADARDLAETHADALR
jgi:hypothetical protein